MVTPASLIARHPEFQDVDLALIALVIAEAVAELDDEVIPAGLIDRAVDLHSCDALARSPHGLPLGLVALDGSTLYSRQFDQMVQVHGTAYRLEGV